MSDPAYPDDLLYHPGHGWARLEDGAAVLGITWFAQNALGEVVFFDPPVPGSELRAGRPYAQLESVKATSDVIAPVDGEVVEVNGALESDPLPVNEDPYGEGWLVKVSLAGDGEAAPLLDAAGYRAVLG